MTADELQAELRDLRARVAVLQTLLFSIAQVAQSKGLDSRIIEDILDDAVDTASSAAYGTADSTNTQFAHSLRVLEILENLRNSTLTDHSKH